MLEKNLNKKVIELLKAQPTLRDDFLKLLAVIWRNETPDSGHKQSAFSFWGDLWNHKVIHPESVRRTWQQVQEEIPELRGEKWNKRQKYAKKDIPKEIEENKKDLDQQTDFLS